MTSNQNLPAYKRQNKWTNYLNHVVKNRANAPPHALLLSIVSFRDT